MATPSVQEWAVFPRVYGCQFVKLTLHLHPRLLIPRLRIRADAPPCLRSSLILFYSDSEAVFSFPFCTVSLSNASHTVSIAHSYNRTLVGHCVRKFLLRLNADRITVPWRINRYQFVHCPLRSFGRDSISCFVDLMCSRCGVSEKANDG